MTNHYQKTVELLDEIASLETELATQYRQQRLGHPGSHANRIADLHQRLGRLLKKAAVHSQLAIAQAYYDQPIST